MENITGSSCFNLYLYVDDSISSVPDHITNFLLDIYIYLDVPIAF